MKKKFFLPAIFIFFACELPLHDGTYADKYTLFGNLDVFMAPDTTISSIDTIYFSISSPVGSGSFSEHLYVSGAQVTLSGPSGFEEITFLLV